MKVARFHAPGDVRIEDAPEPTPAARRGQDPGAQLLHLRHRRQDLHFGHHHIEPPRVMGHEIAGEVVEVGADVDGWRPGDRVQVIAAIPCGTLRRVPRGRMTVCPNQESMGYHYDGGFAEYMIVPAGVLAVDGLNRIPDGRQLRRGVRRRAVRLRDQRPGAGPRRRGRRRRRGRLRPDRLPARAAGPGPRRRPGVPGRAQPRPARQAADLVKPDATICAGEVDVVDAVLKLTDGRGVDVVITAAAAGAAQEQAMQMSPGRAGSASSAACPRTTRSSRSTPTSCTTAS